MFENLLVPGAPLLEKSIRTLVVYAALVVLLRIAGRRELAQLNSFDLVVLLLVSNTLQNAIIGNDNSLVGGLFGAAALLGLNHVVVKYLYNHQSLEREIMGQPVLLIDRGAVVQKNLDAETIELDELLVAVHQQGVERIEDVERAILETSGAISVFPHHPAPATDAEAALAARLDRLEGSLARIATLLENGTGKP